MSEESSKADAICLIVSLVMIVVTAVTIIISAGVGAQWAKDAHAHKVEAVRHGAAEWRTDEHGQVSFHWLENRKEAQP